MKNEFVLAEIARKVDDLVPSFSKKPLIQIEGGTCSGKTTFIQELGVFFSSQGINCTLVDEAATKVFEGNLLMYRQLCKCDGNSANLDKIKREIQLRIITMQIEQLKSLIFEKVDLVLMDRGGASSAFFTIPLLTKKETILCESICKKITQTSKLVIILSSLGFLKNSFYRYQRTYNEVRKERIGIKKYLKKWQINFVEINATDKVARNYQGVNCIRELVKDYIT